MQYEYKEIIKGLNQGLIKEFIFCVKDYAHYKKCSIRNVLDLLPSGNIIKRIEVNLTQDDTERVSFFKEMNEEYKLFHMGRRGTFTLKQMWRNIEILNIKFDEGAEEKQECK